MAQYLLKRLFLIIPTLFFILLLNFTIVQFAPGGPIDQMIAKLNGTAIGSFGGGNANNFEASGFESSMGDKYRGAQGLDPDFVKQIEKMYGFDQPAPTRFWLLIKNYLCFDFGRSYFRDIKVIDLIKEKFPVSISLGLWSTLLIYLIAIPLGIRKAVKNGSSFDTISSLIIIICYAIPSFLFAILLMILFAGGNYWQIFPLRGIVSDNWNSLSYLDQIKDYIWHMVLPVIAMVVGGFTSLTLLTKNSFLDEISKQYVLTAKAKGVHHNKILYGHIFRNAMLIVIAGMPAALVNIFFTGSLLIEVIFSLDGLGLLGFESAVTRDYPVVFASLFIFTLVSLVLHLISDIIYMIIDPRINFNKQVYAS